MNLAESLLAALKSYGVQEIFGIPGDFALPFFKVIEESRILPLYTLSHEPAVGFAADAAARFHTKPSVAAVTYGAGAFNMLNPIACAYAEKSPVVVISGGPGRADKSTGFLIHHQAKQLNSQIEIYKEVTCDQVILDDVDAAPAQIARVLANCCRESRPVYIEIPRDQVFEPCKPVPSLPTTREVDADALAACCEEIVSWIRRASAPVLMIGVEVKRYDLEAEVSELSRKLGIPIVTTFMARGTLAGQDGIDLRGTYLGIAGDPDTMELVEASDGLFLLGTLLSDTNFGPSAKKIDLRKTILVCDNNVSLGYHTYPQLPIRRLVNALNERLQLQPARASTKVAYPKALNHANKPITPTDIAMAVNDMFDAHGVMPIAADMGDCLFTALDIEYTDLVAPGYYATMGYGVPAGLGVQAATGRRPLILVGDGAFQMTGLELLNCSRYQWNPIVLVFNNASWEMLRAFQPESQFNDLDSIDFAALADAIGGRGQRVTTTAELHQALESAIDDESCFQLIDMVLARGVISATLTRFVNGMKELRKSQ